MNHSDPQDALNMLAWQIELGADEAIGNEPINRLVAPEPKEMGRQDQAVETAPAPLVLQTADAGAAALAQSAADLPALQAAIEAFDGCPLKLGAQSTVFADGNPAARVMIVGEAPGRDEDMQGKPFVGRSGQLLDRMLAAIGLARSSETAATSVYITNVMPWRPPQNRDPSTDEMSMMKAFLFRHIALAKPEILVTMGNPATKTILDTATGITRMRGVWADYEGIPVLPMFHPAALLRNPLQKRDAWADLLTLKARLDD